jgi:hypothetical protein
MAKTLARKGFAAAAVLLLVLAGACATPGLTYTSLDTGAKVVSNRFSRKLTADQKIAFISLGSSRLEDYFLDQMAVSLVATNKFEVLDRSSLAQIAAEKNYQYSGDVSDEDQQALGAMAGAQVIISTSVVDLDPLIIFQVRAIFIKTGRVAALDSVKIDDPAALRLIKQPAAPRPPQTVLPDPQPRQTAPQVAPQAAPEPATPSISIQNNTGSSAMYVYVSPASQGGWGDDRLGAATLAAGASVTITLSSPISAVSRYNFKLVDSTGKSYVKQNVAVSANGVITFTQADIERAAPTQSTIPSGRNLSTPFSQPQTR